MTGEKTIAVLSDYVNVTVDGIKRKVRNFLSDGTTYISLRDISELLDCLVEWHGDTKTASVTDLHSLVVMSVNGTDVTGDIFRENYDYIETAFGAMASAEELVSTSKEMLAVKEIEKQKIKEFGVDDYDTAVKRAEEAVLLLEKEYGVDAVNEYLNDYGITRNDYIRLTAENDLDIELSEYMISTFPEYKGVKDEAKAYYEENKDAEFKMHSAQVKHILIPTTDENGNALSDADKKKAYETAKAIAKKATAKNFDSLIKEYNNDPGQTDEGYYVTGDGTFVPEFEDMAMSLKEGEISEPVETSYGYHIIYAKKVNEYMPYEDFEQEYISDRYDEINWEYIEKWISEAEIVYYDDVINRILAN
jgi:parvulin-like peptidyl-prolyl isomerase